MHKNFIKKIGGTFEDRALSYQQLRFNEYDKKTRSRTLARFLSAEEHGLILDLGCSRGAWYPILKELGFHRIIGIDLSLERLKIAHRRGMIVVLADGRYSPFKDKIFDSILCIDVLVHILKEVDQKKTIQEIFRIKQNSPLILSVANEKAFEINQKLSMLLFRKVMEKASYCAYFSARRIYKYLIMSGFTVEEVIGLCYIYPAWIRFVSPGFSNITIRVHLFLDSLLGNSYFKVLGHVFFIRARRGS